MNSDLKFFNDCSFVFLPKGFYLIAFSCYLCFFYSSLEQLCLSDIVLSAAYEFKFPFLYFVLYLDFDFK